MLSKHHAKTSICLSVSSGQLRAMSQLNTIIKPHSFIDTSPVDSRGHLMTNRDELLSSTTHSESDQSSGVALHTDNGWTG